MIETLADTYRQLYIAPGPGAKEKYLDIVERGHEPEKRDLSHFITSDEDSMTYEDTPAGTVPVLTLGMRSDFVTFLRIMANRCEEAIIPDTQGASIMDGIINWRKIEQHIEEYDGPDKLEEFRRFTAEKKNYRDTLIVLSTGAYSAIPAAKIGLSDEEWKSLSHTVRKYHECTHFLCMRLYPDKKDVIWDELVADAVGIIAAFGKYDADMEKLFLGIEGDRYTKGRLENYTDVDDDLVEKIRKVLNHFSLITADHPEAGPYESAVLFEEAKDTLWK